MKLVVGGDEAAEPEWASVLKESDRTQLVTCPECPRKAWVDPTTRHYFSDHGHGGWLPADPAEPTPAFHSAHIGETIGQKETPPEQIHVGKPREEGVTLTSKEGGSGAGRIHSAQRSFPIGQNEFLPFLTARELAAEAPAEVDWIARPWVAAGAVTELTGKVKAAGKTTWALALCRAVIDGERFMREPTAKTRVVYLTEQGHSSYVEALKRTGLEESEDLYVDRPISVPSGFVVKRWSPSDRRAGGYPLGGALEEL